MRMRTIALACVLGTSLLAQNRMVVQPEGKTVISRHLYGQFSEHLGHGIYGGLWVGEDSPIPNVRGIRTDVVQALKAIRVPNLRWPGGCFADTYHWKDGIGPRKDRPTIVNTNWGNVTEDNAFGTHEFMDLCEQIGCEPVICGNVGTGSPREMAEWLEYLTFPGRSPMADLRRRNGRDAPWKVTFWEVGNESWGCGGNMRPEYYADLFRQYQTFLPSHGKEALVRIACGPNGDDTAWLDAVVKEAGWCMDDITLHHYTVDWSRKGSATAFDPSLWFKTMRQCLKMDAIIARHAALLDARDPAKRVGLVVDEWGTWFDAEPGTNPSFLYQQNTLRDALVAGITLNIFNNHADRVRMANIAQMVNVLQSLILTRDGKMVLTPTYFVFDLYKVHQDATLLPVALQSEPAGPDKLPSLSASASRDRAGKTHLTLCNLDPAQGKELTVELPGRPAKRVSGRILTASALNAHNTFEDPDAVRPVSFQGARITPGGLKVQLPPACVLALELD